MCIVSLLNILVNQGFFLKFNKQTTSNPVRDQHGFQEIHNIHFSIQCNNGIVTISIKPNNPHRSEKYIVRNAGFFIDYSSSYSGPIEYAPAGITAPLPNYPLFVFIFTLIVNVLLIVRLRRNIE
jgi:hypothetical protein